MNLDFFMNFKFYIEKLCDSSEFRDFKNENADAFLCSGFFSIDKKGGDSQNHLDYFVPSLNKMFSFKLKDGVEKVPVEDYGNSFVPEKVGDGLDFDFGEIEKMIEEGMVKEKVNKKVEKILLSLQGKDGRNYLIGTVFVTGLGMIKIKIDLDEKKIDAFEQKSFFDILRVRKKKD